MSDLPDTRQSLLVRLMDRSEGAWSEFVCIYERSIKEFARAKGLQEADALDVTQEVLAAVEKRIASLSRDPIQNFRGWLYRVSRNLAIDKIKEMLHSPRTGGEALNALIEEQLGEDNQDSREFEFHYRKQLVHWAASRVKPQVSEKTWMAFWLTTMENRSADEVSRILGLTRGNVYAAKFRVINRLQKLVTRFKDPDDFSKLMGHSNSTD